MVLVIIIPRLARRVRLPGAVGLLLSGVVFGPHVLGIFPPQHPVAQFFSELGMLLLMFFAGLEINLTLFRQKIFRSIVFGVATTSVPLLLGTMATLWLDYGLLPAIVVGSPRWMFRDGVIHVQHPAESCAVAKLALKLHQLRRPGLGQRVGKFRRPGDGSHHGLAFPAVQKLSGF